ncbi:hypothetical protein QBC44DRAFT_377012 [Cladorrhinum sp. PSN332]|nr:hypothetical protein QBC44DRAFT_377012 [Cladorrhinum sp. PSN332]
MRHLSRMLSGRLVKIAVGQEPVKHEYHIHESLLLEASEFFKKALMGPFKESQGVLELPEEESATVETFIKWLYSRACENTPLVKLAAKDESNMFLYLKTYAFADKYMITELENDVMKEVHAYLSSGPVISEEFYLSSNINGEDEPFFRSIVVGPIPEQVRFIFENTRPAARMRPLLVDHFLLHSSYPNMGASAKEGFKNLAEDVPDFGSCLVDRMFHWAAVKNRDVCDETHNTIGKLKQYCDN